MAEFGEKAMYHATKNAARDMFKIERAWGYGNHLGNLCVSNGYIIGTAFGVFKVHSTKRIPKDE